MHDKNTPIGEFLDAAAARQPTPGGGSVAALAGALASAMGEMVVNYSLGKKALAEHAQAFESALDEYHRARLLMLELMVEDQSAYETLTLARKLPAELPERANAIAEAAMICIGVPETLAAAAVAVLEITDKLADVANRFLLSDLAICADLAMTTLRAALYSVRINLPEIVDADQRWRIEASSAQLLSRGLMLIQGLSPRIWQRVNRGN